MGDERHAGLVGTLDVVAKGEESVAAQGHAGHAVQPGPALLPGKGLGLLCEELLPHAVRQYVHVFVGDVHIDGVVPVRAADIGFKGQIQHLGALAEIPVVRLVACQAGAVDPALLARAHADNLTVLCIAHRVRLGVFQGDQGHDQIPLGLLRESLIGGRHVF